MAGYMEGYGTGDARRGKWLKRIFGIWLPAVLVILALYFYFRTWPQERVMDRFVETLGKKDHQAAFAMWCSDSHPCTKYFGMKEFKEAWGPEGDYRDVSQLKFDHIEYCGQGVVFEASYPNEKPFGLFVERKSDMISFYSDPRCVQKRFHFDKLFDRLFR